MKYLFQKGNKINLGRKHTKWTKEKMSISHKNKKYALGCKHSEKANREKSIREMGKDNPAWKGGKIGKECLECKKIFYQRRCEKKKFCSVKCKSVAFGRKQRGKNNPNWKGGRSQGYLKYLTERKWDEIRKQVYERDGWACQDCDKHCQAKEIQCHHIIPVILGGTDNKSNLQTLDNSCHTKTDYQFRFVL